MVSNIRLEPISMFIIKWLRPSWLILANDQLTRLKTTIVFISESLPDPNMNRSRTWMLAVMVSWGLLALGRSQTTQSLHLQLSQVNSLLGSLTP